MLIQVSLGGPDGVNVNAEIDELGGYSTEALSDTLTRVSRTALALWIAMPAADEAPPVTDEALAENDDSAGD